MGNRSHAASLGPRAGFAGEREREWTIYSKRKALSENYLTPLYISDCRRKRSTRVVRLFLELFLNHRAENALLELGKDAAIYEDRWNHTGTDGSRVRSIGFDCTAR